jgi:hypothetical protein
MFTILCFAPLDNKIKVHFKFDIGNGTVEDEQHFDNADVAKSYLLGSLFDYFKVQFDRYLAGLNYFYEHASGYTEFSENRINLKETIAYYNWIYKESNSEEALKIVKYFNIIKQKIAGAMPSNKRNPQDYDTFYQLYQYLFESAKMMMDIMNDKMSLAA